MCRRPTSVSRPTRRGSQYNACQGHGFRHAVSHRKTIHLTRRRAVVQYVATPYMERTPSHAEWQRGSAELLILSLVEARPRHGYEISKLIEQRSGGAIRFHVASLYPMLYRLERRGWLQGRWVEKSGQRRRRYYRVTRQGRRVFASQLRGWHEFVAGINRITEAENA